MVDQCIAKVYTTSDHSKFKHLDGNRSVTELRANKIRKSIEKNGYIFNPIIVNEKMEIIDGAGRQAVLEDMQMPVDYIIRPGLSVKDCQALNSASSTWKLMDYINSYADLGNTNYIYLRNLMTRFPEISIESIVFSITGNISPNKYEIVDGNFHCDDQQYNNAGYLLEYANMFVPTVKKIQKARTSIVLNAVMFARTIPQIDHNDLLKRFQKYYLTDLVVDMINTDSVMKGISTIYNYKRTSKSKKIHLEYEYKKYQEERNPFYNARYGSRKDDNK